MHELFPKDEMPKLFKGKGCEKCHRTGYSCRGAIYELFEPSNEIIRKLTKDASDTELRAEAVRADGLAEVAEGITTLEEILRITADVK